MKQILFLVFALVLLSSSCKKDKQSNPIDQLPPETQTGANTFGCLVDGKAFKPEGASMIGGSLQCNYQLVNGGYYLVLIARNKTDGNPLTSVGLFTDSLPITQGTKLILKTRINGNPSGDYFKALNASQYQRYETDGLSYTGELWIKKFDPNNQVISGTFWFDAANSSGQKIEVREGRFDTHYTQ